MDRKSDHRIVYEIEETVDATKAASGAKIVEIKKHNCENIISNFTLTFSIMQISNFNYTHSTNYLNNSIPRGLVVFSTCVQLTVRLAIEMQTVIGRSPG